MANYNNLKAGIDAVIKTNGRQEISGAALNAQLKNMIAELGAGYQYMGVATPATNPGTPDANVFYLASEAGTYTNFGGIVINEGEVCALVWNGTWAKEVTGIATADQLNQLGQEVGDSIGFDVIAEQNYDEIVNTGWNSASEDFSLTANGKYLIKLYSDVDLGQSEIVVNTAITSSQLVREIIHITGERDLSQGIEVEYFATQNSPKLIVSVRGVTNAGKIYAVGYDASSLRKVIDIVTEEIQKDKAPTIVDGGNISSILKDNMDYVEIPNGKTELSQPIVYNRDNIRLFGKIWGYSNDPNGLFPATKGCIIDNSANNTPAIVVNPNVSHRSGMLDEFGINGPAADSDVRELLDISDLSKNAGIYIQNSLDQFRICRVNLQGCGIGISIDNALDACNIDRINADGCNVGIYGKTGGYFVLIQNNLLSDCFTYGLCLKRRENVDGFSAYIIQNNIFVRNGYGHNPNVVDTPPASVYIEGGRHSIIGNQFNSPGQWKNWIPGDSGYGQTFSRNDVPALYLKGSNCVVANNGFSLSAEIQYGIVIEGDNNLIDSSNIGVRRIKIKGNNNIVRYIKDCVVTIESGTGNVVESAI